MFDVCFPLEATEGVCELENEMEWFEKFPFCEITDENGSVGGRVGGRVEEGCGQEEEEEENIDEEVVFWKDAWEFVMFVKDKLAFIKGSTRELFMFGKRYDDAIKDEFENGFMLLQFSCSWGSCCLWLVV